MGSPFGVFRDWYGLDLAGSALALHHLNAKCDMSDKSPILLWYRRDLRLSDHPALSAAANAGRPVIPVFIKDKSVNALGAAPKWRLGLGVGALADSLEGVSSRLLLREGDALEVLQALIKETGAGAVYWSRLYDPDSVQRDSKIKETLCNDGIEAKSFGGHVMFEPWTVETKAGDCYKVYTPFWNNVKTRDVEPPLSAPSGSEWSSIVTPATAL